MARVGRGVGERDVLLVGVEDALVDGLLGLRADDGAERVELERDLAVEAPGLIADEEAAVALGVVEQREAERDPLPAEVVVQLALL